MAGKAQLTIDVTATTSGAVADLKKAEQAVDNYGDAAKTATKKSKDVAGAIDSVGGVAGGATTGLRDMSDAVAMAGFPEFAAGMQVAAVGLESLDGAATLYKAAQEGLSKAVAFFDGIMKALKLTILSNPIFLMAAVVIAIGAAFVLAYTKCETFRNIVDAAVRFVWDTIQTVYHWVADNWPLLLIILTGPFGLAVTAIVKYRDEIWDAIKAVFNWFKDTWDKVSGFITGPFTSAVSVVTGARDDIWNVIKAVYNWVKDNWPLLLAILTGPFGLAALAIVTHRDTIWNAIKAVYNWFRDTWADITGWITGAFTAAVDTITGARDDIWDAIKSVYNWFRDSWNKVKDWLTKPFTDGWNTINGIIDDMLAAVQSVIDLIKKIKLPDLGSLVGKITPWAVIPGAPAVAGLSAAPRVAGRAMSTTSSAGGVTINISGALDPDAVARQIERILTGRARRVGGVNRTAGRL
jgi:phage-related protein